MTSLKCQGSMTAEELSRDLQISQVAVRQHLSLLEAEGIISIHVDRRGLGRPTHQYRLTPIGDEKFPRQYDRLAIELLEALRDWQGEDAIDNLLGCKRERVQAMLRPRLRNRSFEARLQEIARFQTEQDYMAEVTEDEEGTLRLVQHNCAVCAIARNHPNACCVGDMAMFQQMLGGAEIVREKYMPNGDHTCTYRVRQCDEMDQEIGSVMEMSAP